LIRPTIPPARPKQNRIGSSSSPLVDTGYQKIVFRAQRTATITASVATT
jgi:hypothetical protein